MYINISNISKAHFRNYNGINILTKGIVAKVGDVEESTKEDGEKYGKFLLIQKRSTVYALAFGETYQLWKEVLLIDKVFKFPPDTFYCKPKWNSNSTCKFDITFLRQSKPAKVVRPGVVSNADCDTSSLRKVSKLLRTSQTFTRKLKSIKFNCSEVHRYMGCNVCNFSIPRQHSDGKYYCKGLCNNKKSRRSKIGVATERKICFTIRNVKLTDGRNDTVESVVIFNSVSELLLKKCGDDFDTDNEAMSAWSELAANNCFDITLKRNKKKKSSKYPATVFVHSIEKVIAVASSTCSKPEQLPEPSEYSYDGYDETNDIIEGKKKKKKIPKLPTFEIKLQDSTEKFRDYVAKYRISSKPPGLVLLINNFNFPYRKEEDEKQRRGSEVDIHMLYLVFLEMGFEIYGNRSHNDIKTRQEFGELINNFRFELCRREVDSVFIVISSHGRNNEIELPGAEKHMICVVDDIMIPFSDKHLPLYQGKPKVFMPITCQNLGNSATGKSLEFRDNKLFDMLVCCPSLPGYSQLRVTKKGSLFVHCLVYNLTKYARSWHLKDILDKVQIDMKNEIVKRGLDITVSHYLSSTFGCFVLVPTEGTEGDNDSNPFQHMEIDSD
ncbi:uncharacterized protein LOC119080014 [Bradysia coprophila]|uniref:uncharacterized protein LOC119080014 n=1 Tax=Bradysia coprophila TaxID=38358 RepID=UPI00187DAC9B|nr:uncharacterized protein LOC119080014 [Bradysia coprophila]